jgi:hypothetical protein
MQIQKKEPVGIAPIGSDSYAKPVIGGRSGEGRSVVAGVELALPLGDHSASGDFNFNFTST